MDSFQSKDTQQQLKEKGFNTEELSVDVNPQPYNRLKMALYETRLKGNQKEVVRDKMVAWKVRGAG